MNNFFIFVVSISAIYGIFALISKALLPFILAFILSYLLQPFIEKIICKLNLKRFHVISFIIFGFIIFTIAILIFIIPILINQLLSLISALPEYKANIQNNILPSLELKLYNIDPQLSIYAKQIFFESINNSFNSIISMFNNFWNYTKSTISFIIILILVPIISFYLLLNWLDIIESIKSLFPLKYKEKILELLSNIDILLSAYIRGQLNICIILVCYYSLLLSFIGLDFSFLIGIISGFIVIIPFVGTLIALISALIISYFDFNDNTHLIYIMFIYSVGYIIESIILTPRIIGNNLGLNPVWVLFAVLTGASAFGFVGALIAIPVAGIIKVLFIALIEIYKKTKFYNSISS